ncbi:ejaculatory bulb-specific protein 3-like [Anoplophora glabripennis]|uniref:ejaculatory bulb-specific protein 3-like n=1 Tax=Anoplophora glabripennis TaxID=217634 RepID=UPI000874DCBB|nr:ejaculatory bulb-specific protein 3-like [Anoplophora glabripennis]
MKVVLLLAALCAFAYARPEYTTKYDNIDLDEILRNERLLKSYFQCLEGTKSCTKDGQELKDILPDALKTKCSQCNENQKRGAEKVIRHLIDNKPDWWKKLEAIYDPEGSYRKAYQEEAEKKGIQLPK